MQGQVQKSRRALLCTAAALTFGPTLAAEASGGATAGKTTSIPRAKLRYYGRITAAVAGFEAVGQALPTKPKPSFFEDEEGPIAELKTAGYLLAVAFKIDGKIPPDKIPQVKLHKALMSDLEALKRASKGGKDAEAKTAFATASASLSAYLQGVELPPLGDSRYNLDAAAAP